MIAPEQLEMAALSSFLSREAIVRALDAGICDDSWQLEENSNTWEYIVETFRRTGDPPTYADIRVITGVTLEPSITDYATYIDSLSALTVERQVTKALVKHAPLLKSDPNGTVERLIGDLSDVVKKTSGHTDYFDSKDSSRRQIVLDRINKIKSGLIVGIPTGLKALDDNGDTFKPGDVVAIQGPLNVGKSSLLMYFCAYAYHFNNNKILYLSPESTRHDVNDRLEPMLGNWLGYKLSNKEIRNGTVNLSQWEKVRDIIEEKDERRWITRDSGDAGAFHVSDIIQLSREHRPDILAIDGVHLISGNGQSWEKMKEASELIKGLAQHQQMVVIGGTQVQRDAVMASDDTAELGQSAYGMAFVEAANKVISLAYKKGDPLMRIWKMPKNRDGSTILNRQYLIFDIDSGVIGDRDMKVDSTSGLVDFD